MQNETFKKIGKDLHGALSIPGNFLSKQAKKISLTGDKKRKNIAATASAAADGTGTQSLSKTCHSNAEIRIEKSLGLNAGSICDTVSKAAGLTAGSIGPSITPTAGVEGICSDNNNSGHSGQYLTATPNGLGSFTKSSHSSGSIRTYPKEEPPIIHCPPSIPSLDHFCTQRRAWIQNGSTSVTTAELKNVLKSGQVWDIMDNSRYGSQNLVKSGYYNLNEPLGILYVKVMQVTNKASSKLFDVEWSLKVGNTERTSYPSRSFKDNPGNTATMNEVFLFDVNGPFQLEMTVAGNPVPTKLGTMAGFSNNQTVTLGHLDLSFCLEPAEKSVHTYRLRKPTEELNKSGIKSDCEVVAMIGLHILEEPVEDRSWETEVLYQGFLTLMIRGGKMASWKRFWAVLEGRAIKLYDAEYQQRKSAVGVIPLAHIVRIEPPDYDKVDVGSNGLSMVVNPFGVEMKTLHGIYSHVDPSELDYCLYAFTDSSHLYEVWSAHLDEGLDRYQENMERRRDLQKIKIARRATQTLSRHSVESSSEPVSPLDEVAETMKDELIELKYVW